MSQVTKIIIAVVITAVVVGGGIYLWQQAAISNIEKKNQNVISFKKKLEESTAKKANAESATSSDISITAVSETWFQNHNWTEWYKATSHRGDLAISYLQKIGKNQAVSKDTAIDLYFQQGLTNYNEELKDYIAFPNCLQQKVAARIGGEYTPGIIQIDIFSTDKKVVDGGSHEIYFSDDWERDELKNSFPRLYGPFNARVKDLMISFAAIDCVDKISSN